MTRGAFVLATVVTGVAVFVLGPGGTTQAALLHDYELNGTYADSLGGSPMVPNGGTLGPTGYTFGANQGLSLSNALPASNYAIEIGLTIENTTGYGKLIDFKDRSSDVGVYEETTSLVFYPYSTGTGGTFNAGVPATLLVTRDGSTGQFVGYVDGVQRFSVIDSANDATFTGPNNIAHFLRDDTVAVDNPTSGFIDFVRIYDSSACLVPATVCKSAGKSLLLLKNDASDDSKNMLKWKWVKDDATTLGDPTTTTNYTLCLYAGSSAAVAVAVPAGSNWQPIGTTGFKFKDPSGSPDGAQGAILKSGNAGKAQALVKGKGTNLPDTLALPLSLPVTAQLVNDTNSTCFEAVYNSFIKNDTKQFKAKAP